MRSGAQLNSRRANSALPIAAAPHGIEHGVQLALDPAAEHIKDR